MDKKELAQQLDGMEYPLDLRNSHIVKKAKENNLVIVYGMSDDLTELRGAVHEEFSSFEGIKFSIDKKGNLKEENDICEGNGIACINAIWVSDSYETIDASWLIKMENDIPYSYFDIMEEGELFCRGLVFSLDDLKKEENEFNGIEMVGIEELEPGDIILIDGMEYTKQVCLVTISEITDDGSVLIEEDVFNHYLEGRKVPKLGNKENDKGLVFTLASPYVNFSTTPE